MGKLFKSFLACSLAFGMAFAPSTTTYAMGADAAVILELSEARSNDFAGLQNGHYVATTNIVKEATDDASIYKNRMHFDTAELTVINGVATVALFIENTSVIYPPEFINQNNEWVEATHEVVSVDGTEYYKFNVVTTSNEIFMRAMGDFPGCRVILNDVELVEVIEGTFAFDGDFSELVNGKYVATQNVWKATADEDSTYKKHMYFETADFVVENGLASVELFIINDDVIYPPEYLTADGEWVFAEMEEVVIDGVDHYKFIVPTTSFELTIKAKGPYPECRVLLSEVQLVEAFEEECTDACCVEEVIVEVIEEEEECTDACCVAE
ncbi:MAG: hypothetical protein ATN36_00045 [Epulopiscium sp. Nele67-Bin005]|nr:MAG: hypothetical protein ATN36_00045 [Epulopiscium sp. Nele67-Bin005]